MFKLILLIYNIILPVAFIFFLPGLVWKLIFRPGWKRTFGERFGFFSRQRKIELAAEKGGIWFHAVSVGESVVALSLIRRLLAEHPGTRVVLTTTTTTGQELARRQAPEGVTVIFSPIDFYWTVRRFYKLLRVDTLVIFETEIWPNLITQAAKFDVDAVLVNARMSDHSCRGYRRFRFFFGPLLAKFNVIAAQSAADAERFKQVSPSANVKAVGNMKFDQHVPADLAGVDYSAYFTADALTIIGASTHPGEEALLINVYKELCGRFPQLRLVIAPRHAERGGEIAGLFKSSGVSFSRRSREAAGAEPVEALLADTTGELVALMKAADVVIMGKSLAGQDEGHNLIEPALLARPIICGKVLRNFRFVLNALQAEDAVLTVDDSELAATLEKLLSDADMRLDLGHRARSAIARHAGAVSEVLRLIK